MEFSLIFPLRGAYPKRIPAFAPCFSRGGEASPGHCVEKRSDAKRREAKRGETKRREAKQSEEKIGEAKQREEKRNKAKRREAKRNKEKRSETKRRSVGRNTIPSLEASCKS